MAAGSEDGNTPAAWTTVTIMLIGFVLGGIAMIMAEPWLVGVAIGIIVLGAVVGKVMQMMGLGATRH